MLGMVQIAWRGMTQGPCICMQGMSVIKLRAFAFGVTH